jgi:mxaJ protein
MIHPVLDRRRRRGAQIRIRGAKVIRKRARKIVHAVAVGDVDVAAIWGPVAGYFALKEKPPLVVTSIAGSVEARLPFDIATGVRRTDRELKAKVDSALMSLALQIQTILASYSVPVL